MSRRSKDEFPTAISLFSGAGGFDLGVEAAGFDVRCAVELDPFAARTLELNQWLATTTPREFESWFEKEGFRPYKRWQRETMSNLRARLATGVGRRHGGSGYAVMKRDLRQLTSAELMVAARTRRGTLSLLFGGPPCQSFSRAGQRRAVEDERGRLFLEFVRIAKDLQPRWVLFENVKGLLHSRATVWRMCCATCGLSEVPGFDPAAGVPRRGKADVPCRRCSSKATRWEIELDKRGGSLDWVQSAFERIGYRTTVCLLDAADFGVPQRRERLFLLGTRDGERLLAPSPLLAPSEHASVWDALFRAPNPDHAWPIDPERAVLWVKNVVRPHDERVTWSLQSPSPTIGAHQAAKLAIAPNGVPHEQLSRQQWHVLGRRQGHSPPVEVEHAYLSDRDLLLLQTFPESWYLAGNRMKRASQIGNAVPPRLAEQVARSLVSSADGATRVASVVRESVSSA